jgi:hypothetical protein
VSFVIGLAPETFIAIHSIKRILLCALRECLALMLVRQQDRFSRNLFWVEAVRSVAAGFERHKLILFRASNEMSINSVRNVMDSRCLR